MRRGVQLSPDAVRQLGRLRAADRSKLKEQIRLRLQDDDAAVENRNRFRLRRPVGEAVFELRVDPWRVFYRVDGSEVFVLLIGKKVREAVIIDGQRYVL